MDKLQVGIGFFLVYLIGTLLPQFSVFFCIMASSSPFGYIAFLTMLSTNLQTEYKREVSKWNFHVEDVKAEGTVVSSFTLTAMFVHLLNCLFMSVFCDACKL